MCLGPSVLEDTLELPNAAIIDYMHQVLLGVVKTFLFNLHQKRLSKRYSEVVSNRLKSIIFPSGSGRKFRFLDLIMYWKASELKYFTFYGLSALHGVIHENLFAHFCLLSLAIRMLAEFLATNVIREARSFIEVYQKKVTSFFTDSAEVYNMHSLRHLADQVQSKGPLAAISAMGFESANYQLTRTVSQTVSSQATPDIVVKRYLRKFNVEQRQNSNYSNEVRLSNKIVETGLPAHLQPSEPFQSYLKITLSKRKFFAHKSSCKGTGCAQFSTYTAKTKAGSTTKIGRIEEFISSNSDLYVYVRSFKTVSSLVSIAEQDCTEKEIKDCLQNSLEARHLHFTIEPENDFKLLPASSLISPCIVYKCGSFLLCSVLCNIVEHD